MPSDSTLCRYCNYPSDGEYLCDLTLPDVCDPCKKLSEIEAKVKEIRRMLVGLENERQQLKTEANQHHDKIIHRLPPEISAEIFEFCIPEDMMTVDLENVSSRYTICAPLVISVVCKAWRDLAFSAPRLWQTLPFCSLETKVYSLPNPLTVTRWIERSGQLPLSIALRVASPAQEGAAIQILDVLNQFSTRWSEVRYEGPTSLFSHTQDLPNLRALHIDCDGYFGDETLKLYPSRLDTLSLAGISITQTDFDCNHLTHLTLGIGDASLFEVHEVLHRARNLTYCNFGWRKPDLESDIPDDFEPVFLSLNPWEYPSLRELVVSAPLYRILFQRLLCPSLCATTLDIIKFGADMSIVIDFLERSRSSLQKLTFTGNIHLSISDVELLCDALPTLQHLRFMNDSLNTIAPLIFWKLAVFSTIEGKKVPAYLPVLSSLSVEWHEAYDDWETIAEMFGYFSETPPEDRYLRRALKSVTIFANPHAKLTDAGWEPGGELDTVSEDAVRRILWLRDAGVEWKIQIGQAADDLIELAVKHYGIST